MTIRGRVTVASASYFDSEGVADERVAAILRWAWRGQAMTPTPEQRAEKMVKLVDGFGVRLSEEGWAVMYEKFAASIREAVEAALTEAATKLKGYGCRCVGAMGSIDPPDEAHQQVCPRKLAAAIHSRGSQPDNDRPSTPTAQEGKETA